MMPPSPSNADQSAPQHYPIRVYGDPVLTQPAAKVGVFNTYELRELLRRMFYTMYAANGVGLAAPQIGISKRIAVIDISGSEAMDPKQMLVLINPEILERSGAQRCEEGCLSLPGFFAPVERPGRVTVRAQNYMGEWTEATGEGLLARVLLHEVEHLDGTLFTTHLSVLKRDLIRRRIHKRRRDGTWLPR